MSYMSSLADILMILVLGFAALYALSKAILCFMVSNLMKQHGWDLGASNERTDGIVAAIVSVFLFAAAFRIAWGLGV